MGVVIFQMQGGVIAGVTSPVFTRRTDVLHLASGTCDLAFTLCAACVGAAMLAGDDFITESFVSTFTHVSQPGALISTSPLGRIVTIIPESLRRGDTPTGQGAGQGAGRAAQCHQQRQQQAGERRGDKHGGGGGHSSVQIRGLGSKLLSYAGLQYKIKMVFMRSTAYEL